ncbi:protein-disulfide reductase DsbD [Pseudaeromonas sharmana]|uniref:Thiol:disulfide interchange protein DsbD n=1 Tax=Pseudaeromonas sharmana TaxID=328412 RepID=A0ABV8CRV1_9GAMM
MFLRLFNSGALRQFVSALLFGILSPWAITAFAQTAPSADDLLNQLGVAQPAATPRFLPAEQAFAVQLQAYPDHVTVTIDIAPGYYLYRDKLSWRLQSGAAPQVTLPAGQAHADEFFGTTEVYTEVLQFDIPLPVRQGSDQLTLHYQGCTTGMCYPPRQVRISLQASQESETSGAPARPAAQDVGQATSPVAADSAAMPEAAEDTPLTSTSGTAPMTAQAAQGGWRSALLFLLLGIGLAFTPCVLPMYPILSAIILGRGGLSGRRAFTLSLAYVQGMALTYTLFGLAVASVGASLQIWLQQPPVLLAFSLLFLLLALPMFGLFELQLPASLQTRLQQLAGRQQGGSLPGVLVMGALSALVCSPCTTAPLSGALLYVAQGGDWRQGALLLYLLAFGMGLPLLLLGTLGNRWLPRSGMWMVRVRQVFGFVLLAAPLLLLSRLMPAWLPPLMWSLWLLALLLFVALRCLPGGQWRLAGLALGPLLALLLGWQLWPSPVERLPFETVQDWPQLQQRLAQAQRQGQPVMVDLYADWCSACHQFERETFSDPRVHQSLSGYLLLRADVSAPGDAQTTLLRQLQVPGLPAILFYDDGEAQGRIDGFLNAEAFLDALPSCEQRQSC